MISSSGNVGGYIYVLATLLFVTCFAIVWRCTPLLSEQWWNVVGFKFFHVYAVILYLPCIFVHFNWALTKPEFCFFSKPVEPERLFECLPNSMRPSSGSPGDQDSNSKSHLASSHGEHNNGTDNTVYTPPTLIPPRILPLLHDLSQQMVQAGHQQQLVKIYR